MSEQEPTQIEMMDQSELEEHWRHLYDSTRPEEAQAREEIKEELLRRLAAPRRDLGQRSDRERRLADAFIGLRRGIQRLLEISDGSLLELRSEGDVPRFANPQSKPAVWTVGFVDHDVMKNGARLVGTDIIYGGEAHHEERFPVVLRSDHEAVVRELVERAEEAEQDRDAQKRLREMDREGCTSVKAALNKHTRRLEAQRGHLREENGRLKAENEHLKEIIRSGSDGK